MRAFLTGATGFIGGHVARLLRERGDQVAALVRSPDKATALSRLGCELVEGDLTTPEAIRGGMSGCDAVFHIAGVYKVGIPTSARAAMHDANVSGTERVLDAAIEAGVPRIVYVSTCNVFGNTRGKLVDEGYERPADSFLSTYDETKWLAHRVALDRIARGAPIVIVQPGGVYGPHDHSEVGMMVERAFAGKLPAIAFPTTGIMMSHVEDIAAGIVLVHDKGTIGESYVLSGERSTMREVVRTAAEVAGRKPPTRSVPTRLLKLMVPLGPVVGKMMGTQPNLGELIRASDGVTYWASDRKAREQLGYSGRDLRTGLRQTYEETHGRVATAAR